jgi:hypothetical protein
LTPTLPKTIIGTLLALTCLLASDAEPDGIGTIAGRIADARTDKPLVGASIVVDGTELGSASDVQGRYSVINVPPGEYTLTGSYRGYTRGQARVVVAARCIAHVDLRLRSDSYTGDSIIATLSGLKTITLRRPGVVTCNNAARIAAWKVYLRRQGSICLKDTAWGVEGDTVVEYLVVEDGRCRLVHDARGILVRRRDVTEVRFDWMALLERARKDPLTGKHHALPFNGRAPRDQELMFRLIDEKAESFSLF